MVSQGDAKSLLALCLMALSALQGARGGTAPEDVEAPNGSGRLSFSAFGSLPQR
jgi:hypothetical protein